MTEDEMAGWHHRLYGHEFELKFVIPSPHLASFPSLPASYPLPVHTAPPPPNPRAQLSNCLPCSGTQSVLSPL